MKIITTVREDQPMEQAIYMGNQPRQPYHDPNANTYNPGWWIHPKLGWGGNQNQKNNFQNRPPYQPFSRPLFQPPCPQQPRIVPAAPQPKPLQTTSFEAALEKLTLTTAGFVHDANFINPRSRNVLCGMPNPSGYNTLYTKT
ncbi:hypothetical protein PIB30_088933 [Stylosanthes scabra]|uniref:Uncharacterized protein n=1 Tax=Stylosanthes scabra TaxID=79078 RepID=A0ABU6TWS4_9FABA|nr:hypothetical protein [Stylosanthes scabra]